MKTVILINGAKRSGKDYTAELLRTKLNDTLTISFAGPLKEVVADTFGISTEVLDMYKNSGEKLYLRTPKLSGESFEAITDFRTILQRFGTEGMKPRFGEAVWANVAATTIHETESGTILVPDFRFNVEHAIINSVGCRVITLKIRNDDIDTTDSHSSERELDNFNFDYTIDNTGYTPYLGNKVDEFIKEFSLLS